MITLLLGGARSGKSELAERLAAASARDNGCAVTYIATLRVGNDAALAERVARHRERRPAEWATVEVDAGDGLPAALGSAAGTVLLDSLGPWLALHGSDTDAAFVADPDALCRVLAARRGDTIVVSDEVGLGVIPATAVGGAFRDALGSLNRAVAAVADRVLLVVAGRVLPLDPAPER
jgi:adenosylcobinamide kinase/adenosylcobinamide-phosphate guanylyltransferase